MTRILGAVVVLLVVAAPARAQQTGSVSGTVTGQDGRALSSARVTISALPGRQRSTVTDQNGNYRIPDLPPGMYSIRVELLGYRREERSAVAVADGQNTTVNFMLAQEVISLEELTVNGVAHVQQTNQIRVDRQIRTSETRQDGQPIHTDVNTEKPDDAIEEAVRQFGVYVRWTGTIRQDTLWVFVNGGSNHGEQELDFVGPTGSVAVSGNRWEHSAGGGVIQFLTTRTRVEGFSSLRWSSLTGATRLPGLSTPGTILRDETDVDTTRIDLGAFIAYDPLPRLTLSAGLAYVRNRWDVGRTTEIALDNGISLHVDNQTRLSQHDYGFETRINWNRKTSHQLWGKWRAFAEARLGTDSWRVRVGGGTGF